MFRKSVMLAITVSTALVLQQGAAHASPAPSNGAKVGAVSMAPPIETPDIFIEEPNEAEMVTALEVVENVPDEVLAQGDDATRLYLEERLGAPGTSVRALGVWACVSAIGIAIVANATIISKVAKIKQAIKLAGGTTKLVKKVIAGYKEARKAGFNKRDAIRWGVNEAAKGMGTDLRDALLSLFSISGVVNNCF